MRKYVLFVSVLGLLLFSACQKEFSFETKGSPSSGSLQADVSGDCLPKNVQGVYEAGVVLDAASNFMDVQVNVSETGTYRVYSDTINGMFFQATGSFVTAGLNTVRLVGDGTPLADGIRTFKIMYDTTECIVTVSTLPQGGTEPAEFTLAGGPNTCIDYNLSGVYIKDVALTAANTVAIKVNVTAIGMYTVSTDTSNGITFSGTGAFTTTGEQTILLNGTGTPVVAASTNINVKAGGSSCSFTLGVADAAVFTIDCASAVVDGTYEKGVALDVANTVNVDANVTTAGAYSITTTALNGMTFSGMGNFATTGIQSITLTGSGTPTADGVSTINIPGASPCAFDVVVEAGVPATDMVWKFTAGGVTYQGTTEDAEPMSAGAVTMLNISGSSPAGGGLTIALLNSSGGISAGTYSGSAQAGKLATFAYNDLAIGWLAGFGSGAAVNIDITTYDLANHVIQGTFSGTVKDILAGTSSPITAGSFKAYLP